MDAASGARMSGPRGAEAGTGLPGGREVLAHAGEEATQRRS